MKEPLISWEQSLLKIELGIPLLKGSVWGGHSTCLRFVEKRSLKLRLHHHHQSLRVEIKFQHLVLGLFLNKLCKLNLKEKKFWREFEAKKGVQVMKKTKQEPFFKIFWIWIF